MSKWYYIALGAFCISMVGLQAYQEYVKAECRFEAMKLGKTPEDISKYCK